MSQTQCHDCGCFEGEIHAFGCDMERCPICGGQLISCDCTPLAVNKNSVIFKHNKEMKRIPFIEWPNICQRCGDLWPEIFMVPDEEWKHYIEIGERDKMLCKPCYNEIKKLIDKEEK